MLSVKDSKQSYTYEAIRPNSLTQLASLLKAKPAVVSEIRAELYEQGLLAATPARQLAQVAITTRCGNNAKDGISALALLSVPVIPAKVFGEKVHFGGGAAEDGNPGGALLRGYKGFKTPLSVLEDLPEKHSFVDLLERFLLGAAKRSGETSILEAERVELGAAVIFGRTAQATFDLGQFFRESAKYGLPEEISGMHRDVVQLSGPAISRLANLTEKPLVEL